MVAPIRPKLYDVQRDIVCHELSRPGVPIFQLLTKLDTAKSSFKKPDGREIGHTLNEKRLLHGTKPQAVVPLIEQGLN